MTTLKDLVARGADRDAVVAAFVIAAQNPEDYAVGFKARFAPSSPGKPFGDIEYDMTPILLDRVYFQKGTVKYAISGTKDMWDADNYGVTFGGWDCREVLKAARIYWSDDNPVRHFRTVRGLTLQALADAAGVGISVIQRLESKERSTDNLTLKTAVALSSALGISPADLMRKGGL